MEGVTGGGGPVVGRVEDERGIPGDAGSRRWTWSGILLVTVAAACLAVLAFRFHPVGDDYTESDFYGHYAWGARLVQHGVLDPERYGVVGPVYELALAAVGRVVPDLFTAARLLSVVSATGFLAAWFTLLARRTHPRLAVFAILLLAVNPVFVRYAVSATTDMLSAGWLAVAAALAFAGRGRGAALLAGIASGLAALTRYNLIAAAPAIASCGALGLAFGRSRVAGTLAFLLGLSIALVPWTLFAFVRGHPPGETLFANFGFYGDASTSRNVQDAPGGGEGDVPRRSFTRIVGAPPGGFAGRLLRGIPRHAARDARELLGWPAALLAVCGLALGGHRLLRALAPVWITGAFLFAGLLPVFSSDRYSLPLAPVFLAAAALPLGRSIAGRRLAIYGAALGIVAALMLGSTWDTQRRLYRELPIETRRVGRALARIAPPGTKVLSRKAHVGYYAGLEPVLFPRESTLVDLARFARARDVRFLYYARVDCLLRREFAYLLDTTAQVPGLELVLHTEEGPGNLYRIGPEFGRAPAWSSDPYLANLHRARGLVQALPDSESWRERTAVAVEELLENRPRSAAAWAASATAVFPDDTLGWVVQGRALVALGRIEDARLAFERALALDARDAVARDGLRALEERRSPRANPTRRDATP